MNTGMPSLSHGCKSRVCEHFVFKIHVVFKNFLNIYLSVYLFIFVCVGSLLLCARAFSSCGEWRLLSVAVHGFLIAVASLVAEHRL